MRQLISRRSVPPSQVFIVATRDSRHDLVSTRAPLAPAPASTVCSHQARKLVN